MPIVWNEKMAVGNTVIDDEHKLLICLINSVEIALQAPGHANMIRFLLKELHFYTRNHFSQEEKIMLAKEYKEYMQHKIEHQKILAQLDDLEKKLVGMENESDDFTHLEEDIVGLLRSWVIDHVLNVDMKMRSLF